MLTRHRSASGPRRHLPFVLAAGALGTAALPSQTAWLQARIPESALSGLLQHSMAYDVTRSRTVLFGGRVLAGPSLAWTWEHDGIVWTQRNPLNAPPARASAAMAYDALRQRAVVFGGFQPSGSGSPYHGDTWEWDGATWSQRPIAGPSSRTYHAMAWDAARQKVMLFGGLDGTGFRDDLWALDGAGWTPVAAVARPPGRANHAMCYDVARDRLVVFGGRVTTGSVPVGDHWEWNGSAWSNPTPSPAPSARLDPTLTYDPVRQVGVLFSGSTGSSGIQDTWEWDGSAWVQRPTPLSGRDEHDMVWDATWRRMVMHGGLGVATWHYGALTPAASTTFGSGCGSQPPFVSADLAWPGNPSVHVNAATFPLPPGNLVLMLIGLDQTSVPLGSGCSLYFSTSLFTFLVPTNGFSLASVSLAIPPDRLLRGLPLIAQAAVADATAPLGVSVSGGLRVLIGD
ncbi:MAG: hypothetical protein AB7O97_05300 [Planctomycetota bacterium]